MLEFGVIPFPELNLSIMNSNYASHAFGLRFEVWMQQKPPNEPRSIIRSHVQQY
jgi:hypothetical protein